MEYIKKNYHGFFISGIILLVNAGINLWIFFLVLAELARHETISYMGLWMIVPYFGCPLIFFVSFCVGAPLLIVGIVRRYKFYHLKSHIIEEQ